MQSKVPIDKVIDLLAEGNTERQVAVELGCTYQAVNYKIRDAMKKHQCSTRTQLVLKIVMEKQAAANKPETPTIN